MFMPPFPASRNLRPTDGIASYRSTCTPPAPSTSAAIRPAGPPPMMATRLVRVEVDRHRMALAIEGARILVEIEHAKVDVKDA